MGSPASVARDFAMRIAGAYHSRRLYGMRGSGWARTLANLEEALAGHLDPAAGSASELTIALLGDGGLAALGVPLVDPPSSVVRFMGQLKERDVEIISFRPGVCGAELETLMTFLSSDVADVAAVKADHWLKERGVEHISIKHLKLMKGSGVESFRDVYRRGKRVLSREFSRAAQQGVVNMGAVSELARGLLEVILDADAPLATLQALKDRDDCTMVHSVNVATIAGAQASSLGLPEDEVQKIVVAALMHDIGKTKVPESILNKGGPLTPQERQALQRHAAEGARLLFETQGAGQLAAVVAMEHHQELAGGDVGLAATEICRIADVFDSIRTARPFEEAELMAGAAAFMINRMRDRFNPLLLSRFATIAGVCQAGERAWLSTGEEVQVVEPHPEHGLHAAVRVVQTNKGALPPGELLDLRRMIREANAPLLVPPIPSHFQGLTLQEIDDLG